MSDFGIKFLTQLWAGITANLTVPEAAVLVLLAALVVRQEHKRRTGWGLVLYSIGLVIYLTILRRQPGGEAVLRWELALGPDAWAGQCLNLALYLPFGWAMARSQNRLGLQPLLQTALLGLALSLFCEAAQYLTGRGWMDVNDLICNTAGAILGALLWCAGKHWHKNIKIL